MAESLTGKPQLSRMINRRLILERIRRDGEISRADLAKQTAIRPPTVSAIVKELIEEGLIEELGRGETSGGRAPLLLALRRGLPVSLGFELSETSIHAGLCGLNGEVTQQTKVRYKPRSAEEAVELLNKLGERLLGQAGLGWQELVGVGVAVPGRLNSAEGFIHWSKPLGWSGVPLRQLCEAKWGVTTDVVNDSLAGAMAGQLFEIEQSVENLVFLYLRFDDADLDVIGLGVGLILNGEPFLGEHGAAGEITTALTHPCDQTAAGRPYQTIDRFVAAFESGEPAAREGLDRLTRELTPLVLWIVSLLEPGVVMVGSDVPKLRDALLGPLGTAISTQQEQHHLGHTELIPSQLGDFGVVRGATAPALQRLFRVPTLG